MSTVTNLPNGLDAANHLEGAKLENGWTVLEKVVKPAGATGGHFSVCYIVQHNDGQKAFVKALNLGKALNMPGDTLKQIENLIKAFNFERDTLAICRDKKMQRIVAAIDYGKIQPPGSAYPVYYIIFELAQGDIRKHIQTLLNFDLAWTLRVLHHAAVALGQLHMNGIAHQDLKPSNVLTYNERDSKVGDLGCADNRDTGSPRGVLAVAGDKAYAPPELLYNEVALDWDKRRLGCDAYLLGSLAVFLFTGVSINAVMYHELDTAHRPGFWPNDYRTVLPYVRDAFGKAVSQIAVNIPNCVRSEMTAVIEQLCDPDPNQRGHPNNPTMNQFSIERYVSLFDRLAKRAEYGLIKV